LPFFDPAKFEAFTRRESSKVLVDGRWTLAFNSQELCNAAESMVARVMNLQQREVELQLNKLLENEFACSL
jgi:hypothetical protein